jgi:MbtH protein
MTADVDFRVVINVVGQYSVWPAGRSVPEGWHGVAVEGSRQRCLDWIEQNWTDPGPGMPRSAPREAR